jgi:uncharacterized protein YbbK (DUF523 family)
MKPKLLISSCLLGENCCYDGGNRFSSEVKALAGFYELVPVCPEMIAGLPCPREKHEILDNSVSGSLNDQTVVISETGEDHSDIFLRGAKRVLEIVKENGISKAVFKSKSPSCGSGKIYDGTFGRILVDGDGVTAALLKQNQVEVYTEDEIDNL